MPTPKELTMEEKHPELFTPQTNIDRRQCERVLPMEVMNLGFPRTGTMSKSGSSQSYFSSQCHLYPYVGGLFLTIPN